MPINGAKYRIIVDKKGEHIRLAFVNGKVVEAKNMATGEVHTPKEFANDAKKAKKKK